jgi:hypothetical protein
MPEYPVHINSIGVPARTVSRALASIDRNKQLKLADIEARAELEAARAHAVGYVGQQAMHSVAMLSQLEGQLANICPLATTRLQGIADIAALGIAQVVVDSARRLR